jgi:hypothetical protein
MEVEVTKNDTEQGEAGNSAISMYTQSTLV